MKWPKKRRGFYSPKKNTTGVDGRGVPVPAPTDVVEYTELPDSVKKAMTEVIKRKTSETTER